MGCSFVREEPSPKETPEGFRVSKKVSKATLDVAWRVIRYVVLGLVYDGYTWDIMGQ